MYLTLTAYLRDKLKGVFSISLIHHSDRLFVATLAMSKGSAADVPNVIGRFRLLLKVISFSCCPVAPAPAAAKEKCCWWRIVYRDVFSMLRKLMLPKVLLFQIPRFVAGSPLHCLSSTSTTLPERASVVWVLVTNAFKLTVLIVILRPILWSAFVPLGIKFNESWSDCEISDASLAACDRSKYFISGALPPLNLLARKPPVRLTPGTHLRSPRVRCCLSRRLLCLL